MIEVPFRHALLSPLRRFVRAARTKITMINVAIVILCSMLVGAQSTTLDVSITVINHGYPPPAIAFTDVDYELVCSATGPPTNVTWVAPLAGTVGPQTTIGSATSVTLRLKNSLLPLSYAGLYVCNASANGVTKTAIYPFNISLEEPFNAAASGAISLKVLPQPPPYYAGSSVQLKCTYFYEKIDGSVAAQFIWSPISSRSSISQQLDDFGVHSILTISTLSLTDTEPYQCTILVTPITPSPYIISANITWVATLSVTDLPLTVTVSPANLLSSSNSTFQINCTATKPSSVPLPFVFVWSWKDTYNGGSVLTFNSSGTFTSGGTTFVTTQPPGVTNSTPTVTSTLTVSQPSPAGIYYSQCDVMVYVPVDGVVNQSAQAAVFVQGMHRPLQPVGVNATKVSMDTISVQWQIPYIVYTQERYVVQYGLAPSNLSQSSMVVNGSAYLNTSGGQFSVNLTGLIPNSLYYYTIVASNTEGTTSTPVMNISFFPPGGVVSTTIEGSTTYLSVSWSPPLPPNNDVIHYLVVATPFSGGAIRAINVSGLSINITGLYEPGVPYNASVTGYNVLGYGKTVTTYGYIMELAPSKPLNVKVTSVNGSTILVSWEPLSPVEARGFVRYYLVTWSPTTSKARGSTGTVNLTADITMYLITGLDPMLSYTVSASAGTGAGVSMAATVTTVPGATVATPTQSCGQLCIIIVAVIGGCILAIIFMITVIVVCSCLRCRMKRRSVNLRMTDIPDSDKKSQSPPPFAPSSEQPSITERIPEEPDNSYDVIKGIAIPVVEFSAYVAQNHQDRDRGFERDYQAMSMECCKHSMEVAGLLCNKAKNRFHNISPYDYNRVRLIQLGDEEGSDYINASYIDGPNQKHAYIVAQGPMPSTVQDFWKMVWQEKVDTIVMLTLCNEGGKRKCEQYWPESLGETMEPLNGMIVTYDDYVGLADYEIRKMSLSYNGSEELKISHFQFLGWPDHGVPLYSTSLLAFIKRVRNEHHKDGSPLLVHCSAGVGRSGAFIILDYLMQSMTDVVNIQDCLERIRDQRANMVQTLAQYMFIHDALNELITCGDTHIEVSELAASIAKMHQTEPTTGMTGFQNQFKLLEDVCHKPNSNDTSEAKQECNTGKNRYPDRLPNNRDRVRLKSTGVQGGEYINASVIDGYKVRNAYIAAQAPLQETVKDFWRMVWEFKCRVIVVLWPFDEPGFTQFWPLRAGESFAFARLSVSLDSLSIEQFCYKLRLKDDKDPNQLLQVTLFHHPGWSEMECPEDTKSVVTVAESVVKAQMQCGNSSSTNNYVTVVCNDGMGRTGTFITIHAMMERLKTEHVVDFFQFIKSSRIRRPNFVRSLDQYIYCHQVIADYIEMNVAYANFQNLNKPK